MMDTLARALNEQRRMLHRCVLPPETGAVEIKALRPMFKPDQIDRMLRIEIERDREGDLMEFLARSGQLEPGKSWWDQEGPRTFQGVDVYMVNRLPAPGWRIINPMVRP